MLSTAKSEFRIVLLGGCTLSVFGNFGEMVGLIPFLTQFGRNKTGCTPCCSLSSGIRSIIKFQKTKEKARGVVAALSSVTANMIGSLESDQANS